MMNEMVANTTHLSKQQFAHLIPHTDNMSLIDRVEHWNEQHISCSSLSHQNPNNPLKVEGVLSAIHLIEYGAQSIAIHGGLLSGKASPGFLAAAHHAHFYCDDLNEITDELIINASATLRIHNSAVYEFTVSIAHRQILLEARATVITL